MGGCRVEPKAVRMVDSGIGSMRMGKLGKVLVCGLVIACLAMMAPQAFAKSSKGKKAVKLGKAKIELVVDREDEPSLAVEIGKVKKATGYQYVIATNKKFTKNVAKRTVKKRTVTFMGLKPSTKYYVRVRAYRKVSGKKVWGPWSAVKTGWTEEHAAQYAEQLWATVNVRNYGSFAIVLDPKAAPKTVQNFTNLANSGFYDGLTFHRMVTDFALQGGDPNGDGTGGSLQKVVGEFAQNGAVNALAANFQRGTVAMARSSSDNNSASSQFFVTLASSDNVSQSLNNRYAAFGTVDEKGMAVVDAVVAACRAVADQTRNGVIADKTKQPVIESIRVATVNVRVA